jgi:hypothetical protein
MKKNTSINLRTWGIEPRPAALTLFWNSDMKHEIKQCTVHHVCFLPPVT